MLEHQLMLQEFNNRLSLEVKMVEVLETWENIQLYQQ
jgi:hypothetical protein